MYSIVSGTAVSHKHYYHHYPYHRHHNTPSSLIMGLVDKMSSISIPRSRTLSSLTSSSSSITTIVALVLLTSSALLCWQPVAAQSNQAQQQVCPEQGEIAPCVCTVKKNGLDILCETTDLSHITKSMSTLKGKSPIIFYLKLRHNNLPKLQGFLFLALDIRHLTIHNSSLAAIEENSLSSLGEYSRVMHNNFLYKRKMDINNFPKKSEYFCFTKRIIFSQGCFKKINIRLRKDPVTVINTNFMFSLKKDIHMYVCFTVLLGKET